MMWFFVAKNNKKKTSEAFKNFDCHAPFIRSVGNSRKRKSRQKYLVSNWITQNLSKLQFIPTSNKNSRQSRRRLRRTANQTTIIAQQNKKKSRQKGKKETAVWRKSSIESKGGLEKKSCLSFSKKKYLNATSIYLRKWQKKLLLPLRRLFT